LGWDGFLRKGEARVSILQGRESGRPKTGTVA